MAARLLCVHEKKIIKMRESATWEIFSFVIFLRGEVVKAQFLVRVVNDDIV